MQTQGNVDIDKITAESDRDVRNIQEKGKVDANLIDTQGNVDLKRSRHRRSHRVSVNLRTSVKAGSKIVKL